MKLHMLSESLGAGASRLIELRFICFLFVVFPGTLPQQLGRSGCGDFIISPVSGCCFIQPPLIWHGKVATMTDVPIRARESRSEGFLAQDI